MEVNGSINAHIELCHPKLTDLLDDERVIKSESTFCLRDFLFFGFFLTFEECNIITCFLQTVYQCKYIDKL